MIVHWRRHHGDQRFECDRCHMQLSSKRKLSQHWQWHMKHPDYVVRDVGQARFACTVADCDRKYVRRQALVEHVRESHPGVEAPPAANRPVTIAEKLAGVQVETIADGERYSAKSEGDELVAGTSERAVEEIIVKVGESIAQTN